MGKTSTRKKREKLHARLRDAIDTGDDSLEADIRMALSRLESPDNEHETEGERQAFGMFGGSRWGL